jgi:hypothetical protein
MMEWSEVVRTVMAVVTVVIATVGTVTSGIEATAEAEKETSTA